MNTFCILLVLIMNFFTLLCQDVNDQKISSGPSNGTLIIIGGGEIGESLNKKIMEISGGLQIPIVVIPTADGSDNQCHSSSHKRQKCCQFERICQATIKCKAGLVHWRASIIIPITLLKNS
jgi:hypothetical protein